MKYRVTIQVNYCKAFFDFDDIAEATEFFTTAARNRSGSDDAVEPSVMLTIVNAE